MTLARIWATLAAVCCGIALRAPLAPAVAALAAGAVCIAVRRGPALVGLVLVGLGAGASVASWQDRPSALEALAQRVPHCRIHGRIVEHAGGLGTLVRVQRAACDGFEDAREPGTLMLEGTVGEPGGSARGEGYLVPLGREGFDGARRRLGAAASLHGDVSAGAPTNVVLRAAASVRGGLERAMTRRGDAGALLRGLAIGDTAGIDQRDEDSLRSAGLSHLVAVSGSNVAMVVASVALLTRSRGLRMRVALCALALGFFVVIVGPEPSVLRAAAMGAIALVALIGGARTEPLYALGIALTVVLLARPGLLVSAGLHLSAAATAGIVLWAVPLARRLHRLPLPVAVALATTLSAQFAVAPILMATFGEISLVAPIANLLAAPAVPPATVLGLAAGVAGAVIPAAGTLLGYAAAPFAGWILWIGRTLGDRPWAAAHPPRAAALLPAALVLWAALASLARAGDPAGRLTPDA